MNMILTIFKFLVLFVYFLFLWDAIVNIKHELFDFDKDDKDEGPIYILFDLIYFAYSFFNLVLVMKFLHLG